MSAGDVEERPAKRRRSASPVNANGFNAQADFVSFGEELGRVEPQEQQQQQRQPFWDSRYGPADWKRAYEQQHNHPLPPAYTQPLAKNKHGRTEHQQAKFDRLNAKDRPKSKHNLPGYEPWILVKTKLGRRFVYNEQSKTSLWRIPPDLVKALKDFDAWERQQKEKEENARWAEEELKKMRQGSKAEEVIGDADADGSRRRRRSESLQREDEQAMLAELAAQEQAGEEADAKQALKSVEAKVAQPQGDAYETDSSYEEVEVTDSEGEEGDDIAERTAISEAADAQPYQAPEGAPVEFGEDDIAYQLAAMGEDYGLDPEEYGDHSDQDFGDDYEPPLELSDEDAAALFKDMLADHHISPYTPWDKLISDTSDASIVHDDRYTVLTSMKARKDVFDQWVKEAAAALKAQRETMEKLDPRIPYLAFLAERATPKLYWPEFKRKFRKEDAMNDRKLQDKDREKLYRDHINRLRLPESTRKADLQTLLKSVPLQLLNRDTSVDALPQQVLSHLHFISLPERVREEVVQRHIRGLPVAPSGEDGQLDGEEMEERRKEREQRRRREEAMAQRQRQVDEERQRKERDERRAKGMLMEGEREIEAAMRVGRQRN